MIRRLVVFAGVLVAVWLCAAGAPAGSPGGPQRAQAFIGESLVINPVTEGLTSAAKSILEKPTFIAEDLGEAAASGGEDLAGSAAGVLEGSGVIPTLGAGTLAFGTGFAGGSAVCHYVFEIEGCYLFKSTGEKTFSIPGGAGCASCGEWVFNTEATLGTVKRKYVWRWKWWNGANSTAVLGYTAVPEMKKCELSSFSSPPPNATLVLPTSPVLMCEKQSGMQYGAFASAMGSRTYTYNPGGNAGLPEVAFTPSVEWEKKLVSEIKGHEGDAGAKFGERVASAIPGSGVENPYANVTVPSCDGASAAECVERLEELGLTPSVAYLGWPEAVVPEPDLDEPVLSLEEQAEKVQKLTPSGTTKVVKGSTVTVTANPKLAGMPVIVPSDPAPGESPSQYAEKRLAPQPGPTPSLSEQVLGEVNESPEYDPSTVVRPVPKPGTRLDPSGSSEITVQVNPDTSPPAPAGGGGTCGAGIGAIDWSPLNHGLGSKFPFGIFGFFVGWIGEWEEGEGTPPSWAVTILPEGVFGSKGLEIDINLGFMAPVVTVVRAVFLFASFVGLLWFLGTAAAKLQGDGS